MSNISLSKSNQITTFTQLIVGNQDSIQWFLLLLGVLKSKIQKIYNQILNKGLKEFLFFNFPCNWLQRIGVRQNLLYYQQSNVRKLRKKLEFQIKIGWILRISNFWRQLGHCCVVPISFLIQGPQNRCPQIVECICWLASLTWDNESRHMGQCIPWEPPSWTVGGADAGGAWNTTGFSVETEQRIFNCISFLTFTSNNK
jgi:hypothetical protein